MYVRETAREPLEQTKGQEELVVVHVQTQSRRDARGRERERDRKGQKREKKIAGDGRYWAGSGVARCHENDLGAVRAEEEAIDRSRDSLCLNSQPTDRGRAAAAFP